MKSVTENYMPFKTQLLIYNWALVETDSLTTGYQVIMWPELPVITCEVLSPPNNKIRQTQWPSIARQKWYLWGQSHLHKPVAQILVWPATVSLTLLSQFTPITSCGVPYNYLKKEEKTQTQSTDLLLWYVDVGLKWITTIVWFHPGVALKDSGQCIWTSIFCEAIRG